MKKFATAIAAIALIGTPAFAAAPSPAPAPVYNWTGWYAGVNAGASFGRVKTDFSAGPLMCNNPCTVPSGFGGSNTVHPEGFIGGGQIGYNWQASPIWVVGLEADIQGAFEKKYATINDNFSIFQVGLPALFGSQVLAYTTKIDWFGTVRGRIGYVWGNGGVLTYVTGGLAYGQVDTEATKTTNATVLGFATPKSFFITQAGSSSHVNTGWVVGFGTEGKLFIPGWTLKAEALFMDLGTLDATASSASSGIIPGTLAIWNAAPAFTHSHFTDRIFRVGLNYQFH